MDWGNAMQDIFQRAGLLVLLNRVLLVCLLCVPLPALSANYGPTAAQETLWSIASRLRPTTDISTQQMMLALFKANPGAFSADNINALKKGSYLKIPTLGQIRRYNRTQAIREAKRQNVAWQNPQDANRTRAVQTPRASENSRQLQGEINYLSRQLKKAKRENRSLNQRIRKLENKPDATASSPTQLVAEIKTLKDTLQERDNLIKSLRASLSEASNAIKKQHVENQRIFTKLKEVSPESIPPQTVAQTKPQLSLSDGGSSAVPVQQQAKTNKPAIWADEERNEHNEQTTTPATPVSSEQPTKVAQADTGTQPVIKLIDENRNGLAQAQQQEKEQAASGAFSPSKLSFIVALLSLLFILGILWRTFSQNRAIRRDEAAIRQKVEAMDAPIKENDSQKKPDHKRQEPEIVF